MSRHRLARLPFPESRLAGTPPPSENLLVRVVQALPIETLATTPLPTPAKATKPTPAGKAGKIAKGQKPIASPSATPIQVPKINSPIPMLSTTPVQKLAESNPVPNPSAPAALPADGTARAATAGGGNWKTYPPGKMPIGRLIAAAAPWPITASLENERTRKGSSWSILPMPLKRCCGHAHECRIL